MELSHSLVVCMLLPASRSKQADLARFFLVESEQFCITIPFNILDSADWPSIKLSRLWETGDPSVPADIKQEYYSVMVPMHEAPHDVLDEQLRIPTPEGVVACSWNQFTPHVAQTVHQPQLHFQRGCILIEDQPPPDNSEHPDSDSDSGLDNSYLEDLLVRFE
eukprot:2193308-Rhodomonas_salina.1